MKLSTKRRSGIFIAGIRSKCMCIVLAKILLKARTCDLPLAARHTQRFHPYSSPSQLSRLLIRMRDVMMNSWEHTDYLKSQNSVSSNEDSGPSSASGVGSSSPSTSSQISDITTMTTLPLPALSNELVAMGLLKDDESEVSFTRSRYPAGPPTSCPICGDSAVHRHFGGVVSCNGCAAFFRRTIVECKSYKCRKGNKCELKKVKGSSICKYCRFQKCLEIGMIMKAVEPKRIERCVENLNGILGRLLRCRQAAFTDRYKSTIDVYGGIKSYKPMANRQKDGISALMASKAEFSVLRAFFRNSDFTRHLPQGYDLLLSQRQLLTWITCEAVYSNIKHRGFHIGRCYYVDESYMVVDTATVKKYLDSYPGLTHTEALIPYTLRFYSAIAKVSEVMYNAHVDEEEVTALSAIIMLKEISTLVGRNKDIDDRLNQIFRALKDHYDNNYHDVAIRMGNLIGFVDVMMSEVAECRDDLIMMMRLNDQSQQDPPKDSTGYHEFLYRQSIRSQYR
ncbi:unnamed protein product [Bursaphelenchus xylophilus]|uniref:(pine wood nematode) hypothetical protein n=1 Tax=Bursaphelenchus xylophilus TaxID=6326 RepID=A0A1I7S565_BURXY|nr:unnamed protein product [Bursaphelenchus xylophilus]CAG9117748.1 unnamed protein product [Bursaphelenchus xylophilus]